MLILEMPIARPREINCTFDGRNVENRLQFLIWLRIPRQGHIYDGACYTERSGITSVTIQFNSDLFVWTHVLISQMVMVRDAASTMVTFDTR